MSGSGWANNQSKKNIRCLLPVVESSTPLLTTGLGWVWVGLRRACGFRVGLGWYLYFHERRGLRGHPSNGFDIFRHSRFPCLIMATLRATRKSMFQTCVSLGKLPTHMEKHRVCPLYVSGEDTYLLILSYGVIHPRHLAVSPHVYPSKGEFT